MKRTLAAVGALAIASVFASTAVAQTPGTAPLAPPPPAPPYPSSPYPGSAPETPVPPTTAPVTPEPTPPPATPYGPPPTTPTPPITPPFAPYPGSPQPSPAPLSPAPPFAGAPPQAYPTTTGVAPGTATSGAMPDAASKKSDDEARDSGLGLEWLWLKGDLGASYVGLDSLNSSTFSLQHSSSAGPAFGVGAGVRLLFFTLGAVARDLQLSAFNLWEINADASFHMRIDRTDPYFGLRGGYAFVGTLSSSAIGSPSGTSPDVSVHGYNAGFVAGCDYYFNHYLSLGIDLNPEFLFLKRPKAALPADFDALPAAVQMEVLASPLYQESGTSIGFGFTGTAHLGVHL